MMVIQNKCITARSPQLFLDRVTLIHFLAADFLLKEKRIKFKILSQTPWFYRNSFVSSNVTLIIFNNNNKKIHFCNNLFKRYRNHFVKHHFRSLLKH